MIFIKRNVKVVYGSWHKITRALDVIIEPIQYVNQLIWFNMQYGLLINSTSTEIIVHVHKRINQ